MKLKIFFLLLMVSCNQVSNNGAERNNLPVFFTYGESFPNGYAGDGNGHDTITQKFGFYIKRVAGCLVTEGLEDSVKVNNTKSDLKMTKKYGYDWKQKFEEQTKLKLSF